MNIPTKYFLLLATCMQTASFVVAKQQINRLDLDDTFANMFDDMQKSMQHMQQMLTQTGQASVHASVQISVSQTEKSALIIAKGLESNSIEATVNDEGNNLAVKTDQGLINIDIDDNFVGINWEHKQEQEVQNKDGNMQKMVTSFSQQSFNMSLEYPLNLSTDQLKLDYDKEGKTLTIEIPFIIPQAPEKGRKQVPVTMKQTATKR